MIRIFTALIVLLTATHMAHAIEPRIELVLIQGAGFPPTEARSWITSLRRASLNNVQIRRSRAGDEIKVERRGSGTAVSYRVTGELTSRNTLRLPGGEFRQSDVTRIRAWASQLASQGVEGVSGSRNAFGLTSKQLLELQKELSRPVAFSTKEMNRIDAIRRIAASLGMRIDTSVPLRDANEPVGEELKGVSAGAATAILLRPLGAGLTVARTSRGFQYVAIDSRKAKESWPAGWPLDKDQKPRDVAPQLFKFIEDVEIRGISVTRLIEALQPRLELPVFYDHNALAALDIDPAQEVVNLPTGRSYYKRILDRALTPAKLKFEVRLDDNDKPFLWVTTIRDPFKGR